MLQSEWLEYLLKFWSVCVNSIEGIVVHMISCCLNYNVASRHYNASLDFLMLALEEDEQCSDFITERYGEFHLVSVEMIGRCVD